MAATCVGAGDSRLAGRNFKLCALDEASQVMRHDHLSASPGVNCQISTFAFSVYSLMTYHRRKTLGLMTMVLHSESGSLVSLYLSVIV